MGHSFLFTAKDSRVRHREQGAGVGGTSEFLEQKDAMVSPALPNHKPVFYYLIGGRQGDRI